MNFLFSRHSVFVMSEVDGEATERVWLPSSGGLKAEALRVDHGHDRQLHIAVWEVSAAGTAVVRALDDEVVLVEDPSSVGGGLDGGHHKAVLGTDFLFAALLLVRALRCHLVVDPAQIANHFPLPVTFSCMWSLKILLNEVLIAMILVVGSLTKDSLVGDIHTETLLDGKLNISAVDGAS